MGGRGPAGGGVRAEAGLLPAETPAGPASPPESLLGVTLRHLGQTVSQRYGRAVPTWFLWTFLVIVVVGIAIRVVSPALPLRRLTTPVNAVDIVAVTVGYLGLAFHCGSMFYGSTTGAIPLTESAIRSINMMGTASIVWYAVPCVLALIGLRRVPVPLLVLVVAALTVVGVTMYNGASVDTHLASIFAAVVVLTVVPLLTLAPRRTARLSPRPSTA